MDEIERRRLVALDMKLRLRDSRDPILAQKDAAAQRKRGTPAAQEATREVLRQHARSPEDDADKGKVAAPMLMPGRIIRRTHRPNGQLPDYEAEDVTGSV
jgi:hypothetical protein